VQSIGNKAEAEAEANTEHEYECANENEAENLKLKSKVITWLRTWLGITQEGIQVETHNPLYPRDG